MLTLERLRIVQGDFGLEADFSVPEGARVAIIGPSGGGKSTLLATIAGFTPPSSGRVLWRGEDLTQRAPGDRPISILFQDNNLFPHLTAARNVGLGLRPDLKLDHAGHERVEAALERVGLGGLGDRMPSALSGGQIARVALARVLLRARPLILLDEPFAALGPALKAEMLALVEEVVAETSATLLMVSHEPQDARRIAGHTVLVAQGKAYPPVETGQLFARPPAALAEYLGT